MSLCYLAALALGGALQQKPAPPLKTYKLPIGVSVDLPSKPEETTDGDEKEMRTFECETENAVYFVFSTKIPEEEYKAQPPDQQLGYYALGFAGEASGKLLRYKDVLLKGWPGLELMVELPDKTVMWSRLFLVDKSLVQILISYASKEGPPPFSIQTLDSLKLLKSKKGPVEGCVLEFKKLEIVGAPIQLEFPGKAKDEPLETGKDESMTMHRYRHERDLRTFIFAYGTLPDEAMEGAPADAAEQVRRAVLDSMLQQFNAKEIDTETVSQDGHEWLKAKFRVNPLITGRADIALADGRLYTLLSIGPEPWVKSSEFLRFFDSVKLKSNQISSLRDARFPVVR